MVDKVVGFINPNGKEISELSKDEFLGMLVKLNRCLRCMDEDEDVFGDYMIAGDLVSPTQEVQLKILDYLTENMSKVEDDKARAAMVYYTLINLHMFEDGNGRTARFMYDLISGELSDDNISYYFHEDSNNVDEQKSDLERSKGILDVCEVNFIPDEFIADELGFIPQEILEKYSWIRVGVTDSSPPTIDILPKAALDELSEKELTDLDKILNDGTGSGLCPNGLAMLYVANRKGELDKWVELSDSKITPDFEGLLSFFAYKNPEMIGEWTADDFREVIEVGNDVKYHRLKCMIDVFVEPEKYKSSYSGRVYYDEILGTSKFETKEREEFSK